MATTQHPIDDIERVVQWFDNYYRDEIGRFVQHYPKEERVFEVAYEDLRRGCPDVADYYIDDPEAAKQVLKDALSRYDLPVPVDWSKARIHVTGLADALEHEIKDVGGFVPSDLNLEHELLRGQVTKRSEAKPKANEIAFECQRCGTITRMTQTDHEKQEPHECKGCERQGPFVINKKESLESAVDHQLVRIQEPPEEAVGADSADIDVVLEDHLVGEVEPGDRVVVGASIDAILEDDKPVFDLQAKAESVEHLESDFDSLDVEEYREEVEEIAQRTDVHETVVDSIAPSHYGDRDLKEAIAYSLFGGVPQEHEDGKGVRGSIHIFMVGDPGCGKSELLQYVRKISPRSVYTSGAGSTAAGLTCAAMKDDFGDGGWTLEAGALVEANDGVACIDELDDMDEEDRVGMLEAMSEQEISASKAGINATLPARTTVIAAANPVHGRYDTYEPLGEQIDVHPALISRFDLIFTMQDKPDEETDANIASRQLQDAEEIEPEIDPELLRAHVAIGRQLDPKLTDAAKERIKSEYVGFRQVNDDDGPIPITPRMVESMKRLTEASARMRLSETATIDDVERVMKIYKSWLQDVGIDSETGEFDADVVETGTSTSQRQRRRKLKKVIASMEEEYDNGAPKDVVIERMEMDDHDQEKIEHDIQHLKDHGEVYSPKTDTLRTS